MVKLTIRMITGKQYNFEVSLNKTINEIKRMIHDKMFDDYKKGENRTYPSEENKRPPFYDKIRLIYNKIELEDGILHDNIPEINESSEITIHMVIRRSKVTILIYLFPDQISYNYEFHKPLHIEIISEIKEHLQPFILRNLNPPLRRDERIEFKLYKRYGLYTRIELLDSKTLTEYDISDESKIECNIFRDGKEISPRTAYEGINDRGYKKYLKYKNKYLNLKNIN